VNASDKVISLALVPGFCNRQSEACGFAHEGEFSEMPALSIVEFGWVAGFVEKELFWQNGPQKDKERGFGAALLELLLSNFRVAD
jgi:hypothetical protein